MVYKNEDRIKYIPNLIDIIQNQLNEYRKKDFFEFKSSIDKIIGNIISQNEIKSTYLILSELILFINIRNIELDAIIEGFIEKSLDNLGILKVQNFIHLILIHIEEIRYLLSNSNFIEKKNNHLLILDKIMERESKISQFIDDNNSNQVQSKKQKTLLTWLK